MFFQHHAHTHKQNPGKKEDSKRMWPTKKSHPDIQKNKKKANKKTDAIQRNGKKRMMKSKCSMSNLNLNHTNSWLRHLNTHSRECNSAVFTCCVLSWQRLQDDVYEPTKVKCFQPPLISIDQNISSFFTKVKREKNYIWGLQTLHVTRPKLPGEMFNGTVLKKKELTKRKH